MAMLNWQGWAATNFQGWASGSVTPPTTGLKPAGHSSASAKRRRKPSYLELDGEIFEVRDEQHAIEILTTLREAAQETAPVAAKEAVAAAVVKKAKPALEIPRVSVVKPDYGQEFVQQLQAKIDATNEQIAQTYKAALAAVEARRRQIEDDDEDIIMMISAGLL